MGCLRRQVTIVPKIGHTPQEVAEAMGTSKDTILRNIHRPEDDPLRLPAYRINDRDYRIYYQDLLDWIARNYVGARVVFKQSA